MLIGGIVLGLVLGLLAGGRVTNLAMIQLRHIGLLAAAVIVRFGTEALLNADVPLVDQLRVPLLALGFGLLLVGLWSNRAYPGMSLAFVGILSNALVILLNGGYMPIWDQALAIAGFTPADVNTAIHQVVSTSSGADFLTKGLVLGDIIPIPAPFIRNVASLGDIFLTLGLSFFLFASVVRVPTIPGGRPARRGEDDEALTGLAGTAQVPHGAYSSVAPETGLAPALQGQARLERPLVLGAQGAGLAAPALAPLPESAEERERGGVLAAATAALPPIAIPRPAPETVERVRQHPYVRLALNGSFGALWAGQLVSLVGDRIHQFALAGLVLYTTGSVLASVLVFVAAYLPNLVVSPIAGTFVDRWDRKEVLVVSDLLRAACVLLVPIAIVVNVWLVYPLVFLITTVSLFFRPARVAILPNIVERRDLLTANSALWVGETLTEVIGSTLAGLFVAALGTALPIAFWFDAATYLASALLLSTMVPREAEPEDEEAPPDPEATADAAGTGFFNELRAGYRFLRNEPTLLANTVLASAAQLTVGVLNSLTPALMLLYYRTTTFGPIAAWSFVETAIGAGNLIGGFVIGLVGMRFAKGRMIIAGYALWGFLTFLFAITGNLPLALGLSFGSGVANMLFVIPSQTLFQERTPARLMGRVVGFRFAAVFGSMTVAMLVGGILAEFAGPETVIAVFALITVGVGLGGLLVPAVRDA